MSGGRPTVRSRFAPGEMKGANIQSIYATLSGSIVVKNTDFCVVVDIACVREIDDDCTVLKDIAYLEVYPCRKLSLFCSAIGTLDIRPHTVSP
ncbi:MULTISPECIES: hypothetical protein [unclassified Methanoculleus]|jgi:hypothetical protein|uniref:hypothetical protein n=1 Tax=unclassified Methanoculleus TaxID=2619537 RepID=UPI0025CF8065|nr:hypothetical protein [Methanoculleus sp. UBA377]